MLAMSQAVCQKPLDPGRLPQHLNNLAVQLYAAGWIKLSYHNCQAAERAAPSPSWPGGTTNNFYRWQG